MTIKIPSTTKGSPYREKKPVVAEGRVDAPGEGVPSRIK